MPIQKKSPQAAANTDGFKTPMEVAQDEDGQDSQTDQSPVKLPHQIVGELALETGRKTKHKFMSVGLKLWPSSKRQKIIGSVMAVLLMALGFVAANLIQNYLNQRQPVAATEKLPPPATVPSKLTGVQVDPKKNKRPVIGIMIENSPEARPQAGLGSAGVVFEALSEGGITRFLTLFLEQDTKFIGPVRSVRPYYAEWAAGFDAAIAHAGGSPQGLQKVAQLKLRDLDYTKVDAFSRVSERLAPHNLFTSMPALLKAARQKNYGESKFEGFKRKPEHKGTIKKITAKRINFNISRSSLYNTYYVYNKKSNSYKRFMNGQPHVELRGGRQIQPKVVVAMITSHHMSGIYSVYKTTGQGKVIVFQDGKAIRGTWKKAAADKPLKFFDKRNKPIRLNPGQTWITPVGGADEVTFRK